MCIKTRNSDTKSFVEKYWLIWSDKQQRCANKPLHPFLFQYNVIEKEQKNCDFDFLLLLTVFKTDYVPYVSTVMKG
jgi:hypothetical protein